MSSEYDEQLRARRQAALHYHEFPKPGKLEIQATKRWATSATWRSPIRPASPPPAR